MVERASLSRIFLARLGGRRREDLALTADSIDVALQTICAAGRDAWPGIALDSEAFAVHLADRIRKQPDILEALSSLHGTDLFLACACSLGIPTALAEFDRVHLSRVAGLVRRIDSSPAFADEVAQAMRETFLVRASGKQSRISEYSGRGALANWVRVIAVRTALHIHREQRRTSSPAEAEHGFDLPDRVDPELDYLKVSYRGAYEEALKSALASLPDRDALLLKLHYLDGLSIDSIGALYGIHRSTVARWRTRVRNDLLASTREQLQRQLSLTESEFDSIVKLVRSQLAVSIRTVLALRAKPAG